MRTFDVGLGVIVVLHGHGDEPSSAREWGRRLAPAGWEVVAPGAPRCSDGLRSWFSTGPRGAHPEELSRSAARISELVGQLRGGGRAVAVVGFSQGGAVALSLPAAGEARRPDAVVSLCGFLPDVDDDAWFEQIDTGAGAPPLLLVAGADDDVVPPFLSDDAARLLGGSGRSIVSVVEPGGHTVTDATVRRVRSWLGDVVGRPMRVSLGLPVDRVAAGAELVSSDAIVELATAYERSGFDAAYVTDHPAPDARWLDAGGHQAMEPTVALAVAATATDRLLVHTNVYVLPYRNPFLAAKALASLDVVSGGRLIVGVAAGYLRPEFTALGVDFDDRTDRLEDALRLLPRIWGEESLAAAGPGYDARSVTAEPRPLQRPHPPMWVGGNSRAAMRRAVTLAQGWCPFPTPAGMEAAVRTAAIADLATLRHRLLDCVELCAETGRTEPLTICFVPFTLARYLEDPDRGLPGLVEEVAELEEMGVDWVALGVPGMTRGEVMDRAAALSSALDLC